MLKVISGSLSFNAHSDIVRKHCEYIQMRVCNKDEITILETTPYIFGVIEKYFKIIDSPQKIHNEGETKDSKINDYLKYRERQNFVLYACRKLDNRYFFEESKELHEFVSMLGMTHFSAVLRIASEASETVRAIIEKFNV